MTEMGLKASDYNIVEAGSRGPGQKAVDLVRSGDANFLMKGFIDSRDFLKPVVSHENGLNNGRTMSHLGVNKLPNYHKLIVNTDGGMVVYPTLEDKKQIIENAVSAFRAIGYEMPKVAVLSSVEKVNPKIVETVEAAKLEEMNKNGEITGCAVVGPLSYDVAMSAEIARHKGFDCPYCGDFDILVVPNINAGNILGKCWTVSAGALMAGIIVGAKVPIVLNSRGESAKEKFYSLALAALTAAGSEKNA
jgi:phosphate butyryltransferase